MNNWPDRIAAGGSQTQGFKASFDRANIETQAAVANTPGGTVLAGVSDSGGIHGITLGKETLNDRLDKITSATSPALIPEAKPPETISLLPMPICAGNLP